MNLDTLRKRLTQLESRIKADDPLRVCYFVISPKNLEPSAYECDGLTFHQCNDETYNQFQERCTASVTWGDSDKYKVFACQAEPKQPQTAKFDR